MGSKLRKVRQFSEPFKKEKVNQIDEGKITVLQLFRKDRAPGANVASPVVVNEKLYI